MAGKPQLSEVVDPLNTKRKDLAIILGISEETVRQLVLSGVLTSHGTAKFVLAEAVQAHTEHKSHGKALAEQAASKKRVEDERFRKLRLENDQVEQNLLPRDDVRAVFSQALIVLRQNVVAIGRRVAAGVAASNDVDDCRRLIDKETDLSLNACEKCLTDLGGISGLDTADPTEDKTQSI